MKGPVSVYLQRLQEFCSGEAVNDVVLSPTVPSVYFLTVEN